MKKNKGKNVLSKLTREVKNRSSKGVHPNAISKHVMVDNNDKEKTKNLKSNLEAKNLDEFLELAKLSNKQYEVLNEQIVIQSLGSNTNKEILQNQFNNNFLKNSLKNSDIRLFETKPLAIPKRPKWKEGISAVEFDRMERESFLNWRRALASEEEKNMNYAITPFEKNIEVWRQLWHVVEKCNLLIQIVDGRNPLYFRCPDLETYIKDFDSKKQCLLLVNKADLMNEGVRRSWADFFKSKGIQYAFFSALEEGQKIEEELGKEQVDLKDDDNGDDRQEIDDEEDEDEQDGQDVDEQLIYNKFKMFKMMNTAHDDEDEQHEKDEDESKISKISNKSNKSDNENFSNFKNDPESESQRTNSKIPHQEEHTSLKEINSEDLKNTDENIVNPLKIKDEDANSVSENNNFKHITREEIRILNRDQLIEVIKTTIANNTNKSANSVKESSYIGFIGYPNVGKSSVINVLMQKKKVGVALMPGKTKHYQTLFLPGEHKDICLMDCPGLVFPSFTSSKSDMAVNGIIPIDTLREFQSPVSIIIGKIPRKILEWFYKIELPDIYSATQFLQILALKRGFLTGRSLPDEAKTAKMILKDYNSGRLLYCNLRPDFDETIHGSVIAYDSSSMETISKEEKEKMEIIKEIPADFDDDYEKINIDVDTNRNLTTTKENFDQVYFALLEQEKENSSGKDKVMNKGMKRALKFAVKRGEITEEDYEEAMTVEDYENIVNKISSKTKKDLVGVRIISVANK
jgi:large subunit GTPase 1